MRPARRVQVVSPHPQNRRNSQITKLRSLMFHPYVAPTGLYKFTADANPGRRCAVPWAIILPSLQDSRGSQMQKITKRTHSVWIADFRISDLRLSGNGGHRPPLQSRGFAKRTHQSVAAPCGAQSIALRECASRNNASALHEITKRTHCGSLCPSCLCGLPPNYQTKPMTNLTRPFT